MRILEIIRYFLKQVLESLEFMALWSVLLLKKFLGRRTKKPGEVRKILIIQLNSIGDVLMTTPAIRSLKNSFPGAEIDIVTRPHAVTLLRDNPDINRVLGCSDRFWRSIFTDVRSYGTSLAALRELKKTRYDICIDLGGTPGSIVCALILGSNGTYGPERSLRSGVFRYRTAWFYGTIEQKEEHILRRYLEITSALGGADVEEEEKLYIASESRVAGDKFLEENNLKEKPFAVMHAGAKWPPKRWPKERFAELISRLFSDLALVTVLVGTASERSSLEAIRDESGVSGTILAVDMPLQVTGSIISGADVFIGNDSGPAHMAASVGTPLVVLFGPTDPQTCAPFSKNKVILHDKISCWPCILYFRRDRCQMGENICLKELSSENVFNKVEEVITGHGV
ncbi:MAG: glycosyltransferase family 9 protein [Candidatus Tantalella remota]|nr:glycosyltransferase family 9 protein [Candidatus Tantalella remota]